MQGIDLCDGGPRGRSSCHDHGVRTTDATFGRLVRHPPPGALPLLVAAALDGLFVLGMLHGPAGPEQAWSPWWALPAVWVALTLPFERSVTALDVALEPPQR